MITGLYYLNKLSKADQVRFLRNLVTIRSSRLDRKGIPNVISEYLSEEFNGFSRFMYDSFTWSESIEGHGYWSNITNDKNRL